MCAFLATNATGDERVLANLLKSAIIRIPPQPGRLMNLSRKSRDVQKIRGLMSYYERTKNDIIMSRKVKPVVDAARVIEIRKEKKSVEWSYDYDL